MRLSSASLAVLAALAVLPSAEAAAGVVSSRPAPSRRRSTRSPFPFSLSRGHTGPAREDRSPAGLARIAAAEAKRARRCSRNLDQALRGGWGAVAREDALRARTVF